jgi:broad specificity phosphatase PhoE
MVRPVADDFLLIRHGESTWNARALWQGQGDPPLSERGRRQAAALAARLAHEGIELLLASDLRRAAETAAIVGEAVGHAPRLDPRLRELDVGSWTGLGRDEIEAHDPELLARFEAEDPDARPGGGETRREIQQRVRRTFAELAAHHAGRRVAVVTHLGVVRAITRGVELENAAWVRLAMGGLRDGRAGGQRSAPPSAGSESGPTAPGR